MTRHTRRMRNVESSTPTPTLTASDKLCNPFVGYVLITKVNVDTTHSLTQLTLRIRHVKRILVKCQLTLIAPASQTHVCMYVLPPLSDALSMWNTTTTSTVPHCCCCSCSGMNSFISFAQEAGESPQYENSL